MPSTNMRIHVLTLRTPMGTVTLRAMTPTRHIAWRVFCRHINDRQGHGITPKGAREPNTIWIEDMSMDGSGVRLHSFSEVVGKRKGTYEVIEPGEVTEDWDYNGG